MTARESRRIGGPGTLLPRPVESFLSWLLAFACLTVSGYHYLVATLVTPTLQRLVGRQRRDETALLAFPCWLPLCTTSRSEVDRMSPIQRYKQLLDFLRKETAKMKWSDDELVHVIRESNVGRHLATLAMRPAAHDASPAQQPLGQQLIRIWPALLPLPPPMHASEYDISLIVPAYREDGRKVQSKLTKAIQTCCNPEKVQVIVVDAGFCNGLEQEVGGMHGWGELQVISFTDGGGRGPCLNFGANQASGRVYTFCHSDTTLPIHWDFKVIATLDERHSDGSVRANSCAFSFGIDTSEAGLDGAPFPPGIKAVETTANIRTHLYSLPYGDQVLSLPAVVFDYIGGFPDQCLMEDYELVSLLRRRASLLDKFGIADKEQVIIIASPPALCSPRRWQKLGVLYVTHQNSKFVNIYVGGLSPNDLFRLYYKQSPPQRRSELSPWEQAL